MWLKTGSSGLCPTEVSEVTSCATFLLLHNKLPQLGQVQTSNIYSLIVSESQEFWFWLRVYFKVRLGLKDPRCWAEGPSSSLAVD